MVSEIERRVPARDAAVPWAETETVAPWRMRLDSGMVRFIERGFGWWAAHWLWAANATVIGILLGALAAPTLAVLGFTGAAREIHTLYYLLCVQNPTHSYFLFGQQLALEHREMAMFSAQLLTGLAFVRIRERRGKPLVSWKVLVLASVPMAWDAFSQMAGVRDSDWITRSWTGALFMAAYTLWFYPYLDRAFGYKTLPWRAAEASRGSIAGIRT